MKNVSVIITTKNEEDHLENLLKSLQKQSYKEIECIVVDNNSTDRTKMIARKYTQNVFNYGPERSTQRNYGAKKANGNFLLFLDADMKLERRVIESCVAKIEKSQTDAVIIPEISYGKSFWSRVKAYERSFYVGDESIEAARFFRKVTFFRVGGFDEKITGPEDWELSDRVRRQYGISRISIPILHNEGNLGFMELLRKKYYYGKKTPAYLRKAEKGALVSSKTLFFLRRCFYKRPGYILAHPVLFCAMIFMLTAELFAGTFGMISGSFND